MVKSLMKVFWSMVISSALLISAAIPAAAAVWGEPDGSAHPYVGMIIFYQNDQPAWRCSGTLISPTVVLTAGHCTSEAESARVWFDSDLRPYLPYPFAGTNSWAGAPHTHPNFAEFASFPNTYDVGVVVLDEPVDSDTFGVLPNLGVLDDMDIRRGKQNQLFTVVGYGVQQVKPELMEELVRYKATPMLVNLKNALTDGYNIQLSGNAGKKATGGACFGDSGGPVFIGDSNIIGGIVSLGFNSNCVGSSLAYRADTMHVQDWVKDFLPPTPSN